MRQSEFNEVLEEMEDLGYQVPSKKGSRATFLALLNDLSPDDRVIRHAFFVFMQRETYGNKIKPSDILPIMKEICVGSADEAWNEMIDTLDNFAPGQIMSAEWRHPLIRQVKDACNINAQRIRDGNPFALSEMRRQFKEEFERVISLDRSRRDAVVDFRMPAVERMITSIGQRNADRLSAPAAKSVKGIGPATEMPVSKGA